MNLFNELQDWYNSNSENRGKLEAQCHYMKNKTDVIRDLKNLANINCL